MLLVDEDFWQEQRRFLLRHLREFGFGRKSMSLLIEDETRELVGYVLQKIQDRDSVVFEMTSFFNVPVLNTLWRMLAGSRYNKEDAKMAELISILTQLFGAVSMVGAPFSHFPILKYLAPELSGYGVYVRAHSRLWTFLKSELEHHKRTLDPEEPRDLMDVYLATLRSSERLSSSFSEQQLMAMCLDMFMAGSETTSNTLTFCFYFLMINPEVQRKAQQEIDAVIGKGRGPTLEDRPKSV